MDIWRDPCVFRAGKTGCRLNLAVNEARRIPLHFAYEAAVPAGIRLSLRPSSRSARKKSKTLATVLYGAFWQLTPPIPGRDLCCELKRKNERE